MSAKHHLAVEYFEHFLFYLHGHSIICCAITCSSVVLHITVDRISTGGERRLRADVRTSYILDSP